MVDELGRFLLSNILVRPVKQKENSLKEIIVYLACRMMSDGSCQIPCYQEETNCNLTVVKSFLSTIPDDKTEPPVLHRLTPVMWHGMFLSTERKKSINDSYFFCLIR